jgi:hypothetical protein
LPKKSRSFPPLNNNLTNPIVFQFFFLGFFNLPRTVIDFIEYIMEFFLCLLSGIIPSRLLYLLAQPFLNKSCRKSGNAGIVLCVKKEPSGKLS